MRPAFATPRKVLFLLLALCPLPALMAESTSATIAAQSESFSSFASPAATSDPADSVCKRQAAGSAITSPGQIYSSNGVLSVTFYFYTVVDQPGTSSQLTRYCYYSNTGVESPTLRVYPGDKLEIHFVNSIAANTSAVQAMPGMKMPGGGAKPDVLISGCNATSVTANSTNLHFHGLNVSPACGQDEVIHTLIQPQDSFNYTVSIPSNEPSGMYWYHPHPHGYSQNQVLGGATGIIIVEGIQNYNSIVANLPERVLVVRDQALTSAEKAISGNQPGDDLSLNYVPVTYPNYVPGVITTAPTRDEFWRVANTSANSVVNLEEVVNKGLYNLKVVAVDGVPLTDGSGNPTYSTQSSILLPPGARAEFVLYTPAVGATAQLLNAGWNNGPDGDADPARPLANIVASSSDNDSNLPVASIAHAGLPGASSPTASIPRVPEVSSSLPALRFKALNTSSPTVKRSLYFSINSNFTQFYITVNGQTPAVFNMDGSPNITTHAGTVEEWTISNESKMDHAFHIHQIHFRTLAVNGSPVTDYTERDTVNIPHWSGSGAYPSVSLLMDFSDPDIVGTFVYHCHILSHEDLGMMGSIQVLPASN